MGSKTGKHWRRWIRQYQRIIAAVAETITLMGQIDKAIDTHGGWSIL
jgi:hypothetical protein